MGVTVCDCTGVIVLAGVGFGFPQGLFLGGNAGEILGIQGHVVHSAIAAVCGGFGELANVGHPQIGKFHAFDGVAVGGFSVAQVSGIVGVTGSNGAALGVVYRLVIYASRDIAGIPYPIFSGVGKSYLYMSREPVRETSIVASETGAARAIVPRLKHRARSRQKDKNFFRFFIGNSPLIRLILS